MGMLDQLATQQNGVYGGKTKGPNAFFMGDFNIRGKEGSPEIAKKGFKDAWLEMKPKEKGFTFDTDLNGITFRQSNPNPAIPPKRAFKARFDRILYKANPVALKKRDMYMIGTASFFLTLLLAKKPLFSQASNHSTHNQERVFRSGMGCGFQTTLV